MKTLLLALFALMLGAAGLFAAGPLGDDPTSSRTIPLTVEPASSSTRAATTTTTSTNATTSTTTPTTTTAGVDISGPCDEAEHANDPRCVGGDVAAHDDDGHGESSGRGGESGSGGHGGSDDDNEGSDDRSGSNSGSD